MACLESYTVQGEKTLNLYHICPWCFLSLLAIGRISLSRDKLVFFDTNLKQYSCVSFKLFAKWIWKIRNILSYFVSVSFHWRFSLGRQFADLHILCFVDSDCRLLSHAKDLEFLHWSIFPSIFFLDVVESRKSTCNTISTYFYVTSSPLREYEYIINLFLSFFLVFILPFKFHI